MNTVETYTVRLYMGGSLESAKEYIRNFVYHEGLCVTIEPTTFIYTGGEEAGVVIGFVNYPRFPADGPTIFARAMKMAQGLMPHLNQESALLVATDKTEWLRVEPPGARQSPLKKSKPI